MANGYNYSFIENNDCSYPVSAGAPNIPVKLLNYIIPYGTSIDSITIISADTSIIQLDNLLYPTQANLPSDLNTGPESFTPIDSSIYFASELYPDKIAEFKSTGLWETANIATIEISPFQYNIEEGRLIFLKSISFQIWYSYPTGAPRVPGTIKL